MTRDTKVLNVRLPDDIMHFLKVLVADKVYSSRSEAIRDLARQHILENRGEQNAR